MAALDSTIWSYNDCVADQIQLLSALVNMGPCAVGYIQLPVFQAQTTMTALIKRKRIVEDTLLKKEIDFSNSITLHYQKETVRSGVDRRPSSQQALICTVGKQNKWLESAAVQNGIIGPLPIVPVSDMQGYDADSKPGAAARAEQFLVWICFIQVEPVLFSSIFVLAEINFLLAILVRKGVACHRLIVAELMKSVPIDAEQDTVLWVDLAPNRSLCCNCRTVLARLLALASFR